MSGKNCLLTGGAGFLGRYLAAGLQASGYDVTVLDRSQPAGFEWVQADLTDPEWNWIAGRSFPLVVHAAGLAHVMGRDREGGRRFFEVNAGGTRNLLQGLERMGAVPERFVLISTVAVYGRTEGELLDESTPTAATDPYGASKREAEEAVRTWAESHGVRWTILRLPLVYGENAPGNLRAMREGIRTGRYARIGDGSARRSMVWAGDVALVVDGASQVGGVFHLTDGRHPSFRELEESMAAQLGAGGPKRIPYTLARGVAVVGDLIGSISGRRFPMDSDRLAKMTQTLTFCDRLAVEKLNWKPNSVLDLELHG